MILARPPYIPLLLIPFVLLKKGNKKFNDLLFMFFIFFLILSLFYILTFPTPNHPVNLEYFLQNPLNFLKIMVLDFHLHGFRYLLQFIGYLGHINIAMPIIVYLFFGVSFVINFLLSIYYGKIFFNKFLIFLVAVAAITISFILILLSQYLYFTDTINRDNFIQGVAGRYFIPIVIILTFLLPALKKNLNIVKLIILIIPHINIISINKVYNFFY
jgi:hypothetical protein